MEQATVKDHSCDKFGYVDKIMPCFVFQKRLEFLNLKKLRTSHWAFWKNAERDVFGFLITQFWKNHFWRKKTCDLLFQDF